MERGPRDPTLRRRRQQRHAEEVPPEIEVRGDPQIPLSNRGKSRDVLNPIRVQVMKLYPVLVEEPPEEHVRW